MHSCWQLKRHTYFRSSSQFDLFGPGDHCVSCVISDSELMGIRRRVMIVSSILITETAMDRRIKVALAYELEFL
jgi:hypothetical protein